MVLLNHNVVLLLSAMLFYFHSAFHASAQFINVQCVGGCFSPGGNPLATPVACIKGGLITQQPTPSAIAPAYVQNSCICGGGGTVYCTMCAETMTPGYIFSHCPDGGIPGPPSAPTNTPSCVYPNHKYTEPTMNGYGPVTTEIHQKLVDASELASIAYCTNQIISAPLNTWQCHRFCSDFQGMKILFTIDPGEFGGFLNLKNGYIAGYISVQDTGNDPRIAVVFEGTHFPVNLVTDLFLSGRLLPLGYFTSTLCQNCEITKQADQLGIAMLKYLTGPFISALNSFPCARVQVIGHSLGGVMAELFAAFFKPGIDLELITFAKPRVGNKAWADYLNNILDKESKNYRVTHAGDIVPLVPDPKRGFSHPNTEYYIADVTSTPASTIVKCDPSNSNTCSGAQTNLVTNALLTAADALLAILTRDILALGQAVANLVQYVAAHGNYVMNSLGDCSLAGAT